MPIHPDAAHKRAKIAAKARWAQPGARAQQSRVIREARLRRHEQLVDPDGQLAPAERRAQAESSLKAEMTQLSRAAVRARRAAQGGPPAGGGTLRSEEPNLATLTVEELEDERRAMQAELDQAAADYLGRLDGIEATHPLFRWADDDVPRPRAVNHQERALCRSCDGIVWRNLGSTSGWRHGSIGRPIDRSQWQVVDIPCDRVNEEAT